MRIFTAQHCPNASLITPTRPRLALQRCVDHLLRALRLSLPVRSFRHLLCLWRLQRRRAHRVRLGTVRCRSNAPGITPTHLSFAEKPSSYPQPILTLRQPPSRYPSYTTSTSHHILSRAQSFCMRISTVHPRPIAPLITSYLPPLTSQHLSYHPSDRPSRHPPTHRFRLSMSAERVGRSRLPGMRLDTVQCRSNAPGVMPNRLRLAEKFPRTLAPS